MFLIKEITVQLLDFYGTILYKIFSMAFVLYKFYRWLVAPFLVHPPAFPFKAFLGLSVIITLIIGTQDSALETVNSKEIEKETNWPAIILYPWLMFLIGYIIHLFI